jgi:uncharacterized membrane protein YkvA (DUF1232 family)
MTDRKQKLDVDGKTGFFGMIYQNLRLIIRLLKDPRVPFYLKLIPIGTLAYLIFPLDFLPLNPIDDGLVVWLSGYLFIELCPEAVVEEHRKDLRQPVSVDETLSEAPPQVVEATFRDIPPEEEK